MFAVLIHTDLIMLCVDGKRGKFTENSSLVGGVSYRLMCIFISLYVILVSFKIYHSENSDTCFLL